MTLAEIEKIGFHKFVKLYHPNPTDEYTALSDRRIEAEGLLNYIESICQTKNLTVRQWFERNPEEFRNWLEVLGLLKPDYISRTANKIPRDD